MLMVWKELRFDVVKIMELLVVLKVFGKNRIEMKYCGGFSFMDDIVI